MFSHGPDLENLQNNIPVKLISTPKCDLKKCCEEDIISEIVSANMEDYDNFPVVKTDNVGEERIIGLLNVTNLKDDKFSSSTVKEKMEPLSEKNLIGADASILNYIKSAKSAECRLLVSGIEISGMVCLSDLQKLPVRSAIFALITNLEQIMSSLITDKGINFEVWKNYLGTSRIKSIKEEIEKSISQGSFVSELLFTNFNDKILILDKISERTTLSVSVSSELKIIKLLRNKICHGNHYAYTTTDAKKFITDVELCQTLSYSLRSKMSPDKGSVLPAQ